jgi:hypothetical protein
MLRWKRLVVLGFLSWLVPFAISFLAFPLKRVNAPLFGTVMTLVVLMTAGVLFRVYFRSRVVSVAEAVLVGGLWTIANLLLDYPMFAYGPMKMTAGNYYSEVGLAYLIFPAFALGAAGLVSSPRARPAGDEAIH